jgi:hypothetical protein
MTAEEFIKIMKILSLSYSKDFDEDTIKVWYMQFKNIEIEIFKKAINEIIRRNKFMPSIAELLEECEKQNKNKKFSVLEKMKSDGYFKYVSEYDKATKWLESEIIPDWFKEELKKYKDIKLIEEFRKE